MRLFKASFALFVGVGMIAQWAFMIGKGQVVSTEEDTVSGRGRSELAFHWAAELLTAIGLIVAGVALVTSRPWAEWAHTLASGMLLYTVINSPGYFAQRREWPMVGMFAVLLVLTVFSLLVKS